MHRILHHLTGYAKTFYHSRFFRTSSLIGISKVFSSLCNLIFMVYAVNILSKSENGQLQYYLGFLPVILAVAEFGLPSALVKYLAPAIHDKKVIGIVLSSSLLIKFYSFIFLSFLGVLSSLFFSEDPLLIFILIAGGLGNSFLTYFESIFISFEAFYSLAVWNPMANIVRLFILYFANRYSPSPLNSTDIIAIFALGPIFILLFFFLTFEKDRLNWGAKFSEMQQGTKDLALFNLWTFLASIFAIISDRLEIFIINRYHSPESVATYGTALQLFSGFVIILSTLNSVIYPRLAKYNNTKEFNPFLLKAVAGSACVALFLSPGFFLAEFILNFLFGGKYTDAIPVFKILYPNYMLQLVFAPLGIALFAMGKPKILATLAFLRLFFGFILDNLLIPEFGVFGAGVSFFLGQIISWLILAGYFWATIFRD